MTSLYRFFILFLFIFTTSSVNANNPKDDISATCATSMIECIQQVDHYLTAHTDRSRLWYKYKLLQLDALFNLQRTDDLQKEVNYWITQDNIPVTFSVYIYIYQAKLSFGVEPAEKTSEYLNKALALMSKINESIPRPMRLIEIANLQIANKQIEQANKTLLYLEKTYSASGSPLFNQELYANLGHVAIRQQAFDKHLTYRKRCLEYSLQLNNKQQVAVSYYNVGRAYQALESYDKAIEHFNYSIDNAKASHDQVLLLDAKLRVIEMYQLSGDKEKALQLFSEFNQQDLPTSKRLSLRERFTELEQIIKP